MNRIFPQDSSSPTEDLQQALVEKQTQALMKKAEANPEVKEKIVGFGKEIYTGCVDLLNEVPKTMIYVGQKAKESDCVMHMMQFIKLNDLLFGVHTAFAQQHNEGPMNEALDLALDAAVLVAKIYRAGKSAISAAHPDWFPKPDKLDEAITRMYDLRKRVKKYTVGES